jgi:hypothetical protein
MEAMTPERLCELRTVLAAMADAPIATLEAHPLPSKLDRSRGIHLDSASPLAIHLSQLVAQTSKTTPAATASLDGEVLYRMVVPAKVAAQAGGGLIKPMASKAADGGIHSALVGLSGIAAQATFVPVSGNAAAAAGAVGAAGGPGAAAGAAAAGAGALTVAAPLVLLAVAVGVSAHVEQAIENITELLEKLHSDALNRERDELNGCRDAIDKATAILLDEGKIGAALGLDSHVGNINTALAATERRLKGWQRGLEKLGDRRVDLAELRKIFPGIDEEGGEFRAHLELTGLAIALKKRVIVLQAVQHAQMDPSNPFENFVRALKADQERVIRLESEISSVLKTLGALQLDRPRGILDSVFTSGEVDKLLSASYRLREFGEEVVTSARQSDVAIEIARNTDGSVVVFPALSA